LANNEGRKKVRLNNSVKSIEAAPVGRHGIDAKDVVGLYLAVTKNKGGGISRRFILRYHRADDRPGRAKSRPNEISLGVYGRDIDLKGATEKARMLRHEMKSSGIDPVEARRQRSVAVGVTTFADTLAMYAKAFATAPGVADRVRLIERHAGALLPLAVADITPLVARDALAAVQASHAKTSARVRGALSNVFGFAVAHGMRNDNPCDASIWRHLAPPPPKTIPHRMAPYAEVPALYRRLTSMDTNVSLGLALLILVAGRTSEILGLRWGEIDLDQRMIVIPANRMKARTEHRIPIASPALAILAAMRSRHPHSDYCFPAPHGGRFSDRVFEATLHRQFRLPYSVHGLRASFSSYAHEMTEHPHELIELALAHMEGRGNAVARAYNRSDAIERRRALMEDWGRFLEGDQGASKSIISAAAAAE
jgi:integrase